MSLMYINLKFAKVFFLKYSHSKLHCFIFMQIAQNCSGMLKANAAYRLCSRLMDNDPTGQLLFRSVDILWNMLELGSKGEMANQLNNHDCIGWVISIISSFMYVELCVFVSFPKLWLLQPHVSVFRSFLQGYRTDSIQT